MERLKELQDKDGKMMKITGVLDCRTVGAVYGMWCRLQENAMINRVASRVGIKKKDKSDKINQIFVKKGMPRTGFESTESW